MVNFKDCLFTLDGVGYQGVESFHDAIIKNDVRITPEQASIDLKRAQDMGFEHPAEAINSVNKRLGTDYQLLKDVPENQLQQVQKQRSAERVKEGEKSLKESMPEQGQKPDLTTGKAIEEPQLDEKQQELVNTKIDENTTPGTRQKISDAILSLKVSTKGDTTFALPVPPQIWNAFVDVIHKSVMAGVDLVTAIRMAVSDLRKQGLSQDEQDMSELAIRESAGLNRAAREKASEYVLAGHTDAQAMAYLRAQNMSDGVARAILGDAKANPMTRQKRFDELKEAEKEHFKNEGEWLGRKAVNKFVSQQEARKFQDRIRETVPKGKGRTKQANDVDKAIHIYLDLERNPGHLQQYYNQLDPEQKRIVDLSQNLTPEQKVIADDIKTQYREIGLLAKNSEVIREVLDNYVARAWDFGDKPPTEMFSSFKTGTRHTIERTLDTIIQGYAKGYKLGIEGATNNLQALVVEMGNVIENRRLIEQGLKLDFDTGEVDFDGKPIYEKLFRTSPPKGGIPYKKVEAPAFQKWEYAGKVADYDANQLQSFGRRRDVLLTDDGTVMKKEAIYAPEKVARSLNNILGKSSIADTPGINAWTKFNREVKMSILSLSGFHYIAFSRAHALISGKSIWSIGNPVTAYKGGLRLMSEQSDHLKMGIQNGLTLTRRQDFEEGLSEHQAWLGKQMDKLKFTKAAKDGMANLTEAMHKHLFETFGAGLKSFDFVNMYQKEMKKDPTANQSEVAARVAKLINDQYGGINWQRMHGTAMQNPTVRHLSSLLLLAPDWTSSNLRFAKKAFERGEEGALYRKAWGRVLLRGAVLTAVANAGLAFMDERDGEDWEESFTRRYKEAWAQGNLRWLMLDISPLYHWAGGDEGKRAYFSIFGAYTDPLKVVSNPVRYLDNKLSFIAKAGEEALTGQNWQGKQFTTADELFGMDDKGEYKHVYHNKKTGQTFMPGDEKGGKLTGQLTKYAMGGKKPVEINQLPSFFLSQARGMMPIFFQNIWGGAAGENDWTYMLMNAVGTGVVVNKEKGEEK